MTDADVEAAQHTKRGEDEQRYPEDAPMGGELGWNGWSMRAITELALLPKGQCEGQDEQSEKAQGRFQYEQNREIEPYAVRVGVPEDEGRPVPGNQNHRNAAQVEPRWHEDPAQRYGGGAVAETVKDVGSRMQGKNEIDQIDGDGGTEDSLKSGTPAESTPDTRFRFSSGLAGENAPTSA